MDIKEKLRKQQIKARLARMKYVQAKARNESKFNIQLLYSRWSQLEIVCSMWEVAVKMSGEG